MYNEKLGCYEWKEVETDRYVFDETDKIAIARKYHERRCPASEIVSKYHISSAVVLYGWLDKYLNEKVCVTLQPETNNETDMSKKSKQQLEVELKEMKAENKDLQGRGAAHHRLLQRRKTAHERGLADTFRGKLPERVTEKMLEKSVGETSRLKIIAYLSSEKNVNCR